MRSGRQQQSKSRSFSIVLGFITLVSCSEDTDNSTGRVTRLQPDNVAAGSDAGVSAEAGVPAEVDVPADPCDLDADFDGVGDCEDECPADPGKTMPGVCGCGVVDADSDVDGTLDCDDGCPLDGDKTEPGVCGCGISDEADSDQDGAIDCQEECPFDAERTEAGACGCGAPDDLALCLRHRYSFDGEGETLVDLVGGADGTLVNTTLTGTGTLAVEGGMDSEQYVRLPSGIISALGPSATIEAWVSWTGAGGTWQRIFDFGSSDAGPGLQGNGATYLFLTPSNGTDLGLRTAITNNGLNSESFVTTAAPLPAMEPVHVAVVVDGVAETLSLYLQGEFMGQESIAGIALARLADVDNYIGRSQWTFDDEYQGAYDEFRIYSTALSAEQLNVLVSAGPDEVPAELPEAPAAGGGADAGAGAPADEGL